MKNLVVQVADNKYLIRFKVLKSVVSRKHTTKESKVTNRLEIHPNSILVYLYKINKLPLLDIEINDFSNLNKIKIRTKLGYLIYLGRGLSKCSDKDKFDVNTGVRCAIANIEDLDALLAHDINYKILNTNL